MISPRERRCISGRAAAAAKKEALFQLAHLEAALTAKGFLVADRFTVADINAGSVVNIAKGIGLLDSAHPSTIAWLDGLRARPAFRQAMKKAAQ